MVLCANGRGGQPGRNRGLEGGPQSLPGRGKRTEPTWNYRAGPRAIGGLFSEEVVETQSYLTPGTRVWGKPEESREKR